MFGKKRKAEYSMLARMEVVINRLFSMLDKFDLLKELEHVWQERDALMDDNDRLQAENDRLSADVKALHDDCDRLSQNAQQFFNRVQELEQSLQGGDADAESDH